MAKKVIWGVFALALFLRFWNIPDLLRFTLDEELEAFVVRNIITGFHFPAIGISVAPVGIHLSPVFYYLVAVPFAIGNADPLVWGYFASMIGVTTTIVLFFTTKKMTNLKIAFLSTVFYASSFLTVMYDKHFWNVMLMPLLAVLTIYALHQIINGSYRWFIFLAGILALGITSHLSSLCLVILSLYVLLKYKIRIPNTILIVGLFIVVISQLPLLFFESRHEFLQTRTLVDFFSVEHKGLSITRIEENISLLPKLFSRVIYTFGPHDYSREHTYGIVEIGQRDSRIPFVMLILSSLLIIFFALKTNKKIPVGMNLHRDLLVISLGSLILYGMLFSGQIFEFYLLLLVPTLCIILSVSCIKVGEIIRLEKEFLALVVGLFLIFNIAATFQAFDSYSYRNKLKMIDWVKETIQNKPYELHSIGIDHKYEGYRYLFERFAYPPTRSYVDPQLSWLYQKPISEAPSDIIVVISSSEPDYQERINKEKEIYLQNVIAENQFGEINVLVVTR